MLDENIKLLLWDGIYAAREGKKDQARRALERVTSLTSNHDALVDAFYWLSKISDDPAEKRHYLENTLSLDLNHPEARRELAILDGKLNPKEIVNPDALPEPVPGDQKVVAKRFTCPKCGGRMSYAPDGRSLVCEFCQRAEEPRSGLVEEEQDFLLAMATSKGHREPVATQTFRCQGCSADFILPPQELTATCTFCGSQYVVAVEEQRQLVTPDAIIPMAFDRKQAAWILVKWVEKNKIQPQGKVEAPRGIYLPAWTFDIVGEVPWKGRVYRNKRWVAVSGQEVIHYNDVPIPACKELADLLKQALPDFGLSTATVYDARVLSGWPAEVYQLAMADASLEARQFAVRDIRQEITSKQGMLDNLSYSTSSLHIASFKLILVPVWVTVYYYEDEKYRVLINGLTGKVHAETPRRGLSGWLDNLLNG
jgi:DNA-directed RNA polymerase subunit RPC12/RpoP/ribosomal protein S27AE